MPFPERGMGQSQEGKEREECGHVSRDAAVGLNSEFCRLRLFDCGVGAAVPVKLHAAIRGHHDDSWSRTII
jgi:hypothetical protein